MQVHRGRAPLPHTSGDRRRWGSPPGDGRLPRRLELLLLLLLLSFPAAPTPSASRPLPPRAPLLGAGLAARFYQPSSSMVGLALTAWACCIMGRGP